LPLDAGVCYFSDFRMFDSNVSGSSVQAEPRQDMVDGDIFTPAMAMHLATVIASALQNAGCSVAVLEEEHDTALGQ
jgi:hypothetical protein